MTLSPQAALETAVRDAIRSELEYADADCDRMLDGRPPARCGQTFVAVWSGGGRKGGPPSGTPLDEKLSVNVTVTLRVRLPDDRLVRHRDDLHEKTDAIRALIHKDHYDFSIIRAANVLAGRRTSSDISVALPIGFCEGLMLDAVEEVKSEAGAWLGAGKSKATHAGVSQTVRFRGARLLQDAPTAS